MGKRYRLPGEECSEDEHCRLSPLPGARARVDTLLDCEARCDNAAVVNASACRGVVLESDAWTTWCSVLPELVVTATRLRTASYRRLGPPPASPTPPTDADGLLLAVSDPAVVALGRGETPLGVGLLRPLGVFCHYPPQFSFIWNRYYRNNKLH
jgi:hypothetical protein